MNLIELFNTKKYDTDKGTVHDYLKAYDLLFHLKKQENLTLLEIGVQRGDSLRLWADYFINANILGIDVYDHKNIFENSRITEIIKDIRGLNIDELPYSNFDIVIDDASHHIEDQLTAIEKFYPVLNKNGILIIEDIQNLTRFIEEYKNKFNIPFEIIDIRHNNPNCSNDSILIVLRK
jgi:SAM-dependent methyltransferase